jgi:hypothetical protein
MTNQEKIKEQEKTFAEVHKELLDKKEFGLAHKLSSIFYDYGYQNRVDGMEFIKNLHKL